MSRPFGSKNLKKKVVVETPVVNEKLGNEETSYEKKEGE